MEEDRLEMIEAKAGAIVDLGPMNAYSPYVVQMLAEESLELAAEVRRLNGRLEAVCDVVSNAEAFGEPVSSVAVMEAVRGD